MPTVNKDGNTAIDKTKLKSKLCNRWLAGSMCRFVDRCAFAHGEVELRRPGMVTVGAHKSVEYSSGSSTRLEWCGDDYG